MGIWRQGIELKPRNFLQKELTPYRQMPLLAYFGTILSCQPLPCNPAAETPFLPPIWCSDSLSFHKSSSLEECFFTDTGMRTLVGSRPENIEIPESWLEYESTKNVRFPVESPKHMFVRPYSNRKSMTLMIWRATFGLPPAPAARTVALYVYYHYYHYHYHHYVN